MTTAGHADPLGRRLFRWFVLPLALLTFVNAIDRVNISFAANALMHDLHFGPQVFGGGVSAFFVGYLLFQYPHSALLRRIGVKAWLAGSVLCWGLVGLATAFIHSAWQFYALRFLLGVAEAGFAPGVTYFISQWVPTRYRARTLGTILAAIPTALVVGGPLCGWMLGLNNTLHIAPWRFMFLLQAIPNLALAPLAFFYFVDRPSEAGWLSPADRTLLKSEADDPAPGVRTPLLTALRDRRVVLCGACWLLVMTGSYALIFWVPQLVRQISAGDSEFMIGTISAVPQIGLVVGMLANGRLSDAAGERVMHFGVAALFGGTMLITASMIAGPTVLLVLLTLAGVGIGGAQGVFWTVPAALGIGRGRVPVGVIAVLNMAGTAGGIIGPALLGGTRQMTGSFSAGIGVLAVLMILAGIIALLQARATRRMASMRDTPRP